MWLLSNTTGCNDHMTEELVAISRKKGKKEKSDEEFTRRWILSSQIGSHKLYRRQQVYQQWPSQILYNIPL